jgi:hypothetical protein
MNLVRAEWSRLFARRFTKIMMFAILLIMFLVGLGFAAQTHRITEADRAAARVKIAEQMRAYEQYCEREQQNLPQPGVSQPGVPQQGVPQPKAEPCANAGPLFPEDSYLPYQFDFKRQVPTLVLVAAGILALFGFVVGASFVGAEWNSGGMTNLLLWRPRRLQILGAKLGTMLAGVLAVGAGYVALWVAMFWLIAFFRGRLDPLTSGFWQSLGLDAARAVALGLAAAAIGFALASLGRHTAMALGVGVGYALVVEIGTFIIFGVIGTKYPERYRLSTYVGAWLVKKITLYDQTPSCDASGCTDFREYVITWQHGGIVLGTIAVLGLAAAFIAMRRRDVT